MANTVDTGLLPRTYFKAPRVPFDFRALTLAVLGYLVYWGGGLLLQEIFKTNVVGSFFASAFTIFKDLPYIGPQIFTFFKSVFLVGLDGDVSNGFWHMLVGGVWVFVVWSFFGQAIHRICSLRIARDEGLSLYEALKFAARNWITVLLAPVIIAVTIAFFFFCNALAGVIISIPWGGQVLGLILIPLAMISSLLILLIALGGVMGLPLIGAAAAWERNGSLDAISRAFSYIFARPIQFFWNYFLIFLFIGVILLVGNWFIYTLTKSVDFGVWNSRLSVQIDAPKHEATPDTSDYNKLSKQAREDFVTLREKTGQKPGEPAPDVEPFARHIQTVAVSPWSLKLNALTFWAVLNLIWLGIYGFAVYWFLGATTSVYADLRADVDGTEEDEIYLEEEEEDFDALAEAAERSEPAPAAPPPSSPEPDAGTPDAAAPGGDATPSSDAPAEPPAEPDSADGTPPSDEGAPPSTTGPAT